MASYYVWSGATGSANGTTWANAYTTLTAAFSGKGASDVFYVAHDHAESSASSVTLTAPGTLASPTRAICADRAGSVPPVAADLRATATVTTTGSTFLNFAGNTHYDGIIFTAGSGASSSGIIIPSAGAPGMRFDNCSLRIGSSSTASRIYFGNAGANPGALIELNNTTLSFGNSSQFIDLTARAVWRNTPSALLGTIPTQFLGIGTSPRGGNIECIGVDLSAMGSGKTIAPNIGTATSATFRFIDCKLDAAVTKTPAPTAPGGAIADFVRAGAAGVNYTIHQQRVAGLLIEETTIVRTGGASDGTTPLSWKVVTTANCSYSMPFECPPIAIWCDTTGSAKTATVECIASAIMTDAEIWLDLQYLSDASSPQSSFVNDARANLGTAANQTTSSETWGGALTGKFKLAVTFTPQQKGFVYARVKCAKASSTFYIDPLVTLT